MGGSFLLSLLEMLKDIDADKANLSLLQWAGTIITTEERRRKDGDLLSRAYAKTRPDTRQDSRGWWGRGPNAKYLGRTDRRTTDRPTDRPTRQGVDSRVSD